MLDTQIIIRRDQIESCWEKAVDRKTGQGAVQISWRIGSRESTWDWMLKQQKECKSSFI